MEETFPPRTKGNPGSSLRALTKDKKKDQHVSAPAAERGWARPRPAGGMQLALRLGEGTGGKALEYTAHLSRCCCSSGTLQGNDVASFLCAEFLTWVLGKDAEDN